MNLLGCIICFLKVDKKYLTRILKLLGVSIMEVTDVNIPEYHHFLMSSYEYLEIFLLEG